MIMNLGTIRGNEYEGCHQKMSFFTTAYIYSLIYDRKHRIMESFRIKFWGSIKKVLAFRRKYRIM